MYRKATAFVVTAILLTTTASAAPVQPFAPPEPEVPHIRAYEPIAPIPRYSIEPRTLKPIEPVTTIRLREPIAWSRLERLAPEASTLQIRAPLLSLLRKYEYRYETPNRPTMVDGEDYQRHSNHPQSAQAICTVTTPADSGAGSLRQCLVDAAPGDTVDFDPLTFPPTAPVTITLLSPLPYIIADSLTIDGSSAGVVLDGSASLEGDGLVVFGADGVTIRGLQIINFPHAGIGLAGGASNTVIGGDRSVGAPPLGQGNLTSSNGDAGIWLQDIGPMC